MQPDSLIGRSVDKYEIVDLIAHGGMATVYKARQPSIGRTVAIKVIDPEFAKDPTLMQRFRREVELIAELQHPHILPVYDYGEIDGRPYIVMAYMPGGSVHDLIAAPGDILLPNVLKIIDQTADALDYAHQQGVIHRDLKPSNILLDRSGNAHLADFGIAKVLGEDSQQLTGDKIIGTLSYMAPEMFKRDPITPAVDVYALAVTLYQMLTGETPYQGDTAQIIGAHLHEPIPDPRLKRPDLPEDVTDVLHKAMAKYPDERTPSAGQLARELHRAIEQPSDVGATQKSPKAQRTLPVETVADEPIRPRPIAPEPIQPILVQPVYNYPPPEPSRGGSRRRSSGLPTTLLIGIVVVLLFVILMCGVGAYLYFGPPAPAQVDSPQQNAGNPAVETEVVVPTLQPSDTPSSPPTPGGTQPSADQQAIKESVLAFDEQMRYLLQTGDTSTIGNVARGPARDDRISAAGILKEAGDCVWDYDHRGLEVLTIEALTPTKARVTARVDRDGTVRCKDGERPEYAFHGPYIALFISEYQDDRWWVTEYCAAGSKSCPPDLKP